jgi:hypothetical protein
MIVFCRAAAANHDLPGRLPECCCGVLDTGEHPSHLTNYWLESNALHKVCYAKQLGFVN